MPIFLNNKEVTFGQYPNKEINLPIKDLDIKETSYVRFIYVDDSDLFKLGLLKSWLDSMNTKTTLYICYMPYSRMDRVNGDYAISLDYTAKLINDMNFNEVVIREPHSDATLNRVNKSEPDWWCKNRLNKIIQLCSADSVFYPDKGAASRYVDCNFDLPFGSGNKTRNFYDAALRSYKIDGSVGKHVLIVDDLCSKGGTFVLASKFLREAGAISIYLLIAHCEENVFNGEIFNYVDRIYTAKDLPLADHPRITKID